MRLNNKYLFYLLLVILLIGCGYNANYKIGSKFYPPNNPSKIFPFNVALILDPDYCSSSNSTLRGWNTLTYIIGPTLCENSKTLVETVFREYQIFSNIDEANKMSFQLLIIPKVVDTSTLFEEGHVVLRTHTSVLTEWTFLNQQGKNIYLTTAEGSASVQAIHTTAWEKAIDDLFNKLYEEISSSQELQSFADTI